MTDAPKRKALRYLKTLDPISIWRGVMATGASVGVASGIGGSWTAWQQGSPCLAVWLTGTFWAANYLLLMFGTRQSNRIIRTQERTIATQSDLISQLIVAFHGAQPGQ